MLNKTLKTITLSPILPALRCPEAINVDCKTSAELKTDVLLPDEVSATINFSEKRLAEFRLGRACAHDILSTLGYTDFPVRVGEARQPLWPKGLVGSISHAGDIAICAIAAKQELIGLGIDVEVIAKESFDLLDVVASEEEKVAVSSMAGECSYLAKLLFSAKESVFKCQFPLTGTWLEFKQVNLIVDYEHRTFNTEIKNKISNITIRGTWATTEDHIVTIAWAA